MTVNRLVYGLLALGCIFVCMIVIARKVTHSQHRFLDHHQTTPNWEHWIPVIVPTTTTTTKTTLKTKAEGKEEQSETEVKENIAGSLNGGLLADYGTRNVNSLFIYPNAPPSCPGLLNKVHGYSRKNSLTRGLHHNSNDTRLLDVKFMTGLLFDCSHTYSAFSNRYHVSDTERNFPIAFEMLVYYKPLRIQQYIRLLRSLYRPHNVYCIHIDKSSPNWWIKYFRRFASCFPNVIVAKKLINVVYATSGILYAHLRCFDELMNSKQLWKYVVSLHGTELPLRTNREMVDALKKMKGSNIISIGENASDKTSVWNDWITHKYSNNHPGGKVNITVDFTIYKSAASANSAISREMVRFMLSDKRALELKQMLKFAKSAVEFFFSTVNHIEDAPGGIHTLPKHFQMPLIAQRDWSFKMKQHPEWCRARKFYHNICIVSVYDLPRLWNVSKKGLWWFHNKYFVEYDHGVMDCMEDVLLQRNKKES